MTAAIVADGISKSFGEREVLCNLSFTIQPNEIFGLLGPNGAGKTTTIQLLTTLLVPTQGCAWINGYSVLREPVKVRQSIGVALEKQRSFYWRLTGEENLLRFAALYYIPRHTAEKRITGYLKMFNLYEEKDKLVGHYSTGMRAKLSLIRALLPDPAVLFLDEPWGGLDPEMKLEFRDCIARLATDDHRTIFLCSHDLPLVESLCDRVAILDQGLILCQGSPGELIQQIWGKEKEQVMLEIRDLKGLESILPNHSMIVDERKVSIPTDDAKETLINALQRFGAKIEHVAIKEMNLEDVYFYYRGCR